MNKFVDKSSIVAKLKDGYYNTKLPYPKGNGPKKEKARIDHVHDVSKLNSEFESDLYLFFGVLYNPQKQLAFNLASQFANYDKQKTFDYFEKIVLLLKAR